MYPMSTMNGKTTDGQAAPDLLTVEEAARVLRIGRTSAYALARRYLATGRGRAGGAGGAGGSSAAGAAPRAGRVGRAAPITWPIPGY